MSSFEQSDYLSPADSSVDIGISYTSSKLMSQEGVYQLTKDLRAFSEALTALKTVFLDEKIIGNRGLRVAAHERLGELLQVLKMVVDKYSELNSSDILSVAAELIKYVKEYKYEEDSMEVSPDIFRAINNLAMVFSNSVSECLMGDANLTSHSTASSLNEDFASKSLHNESNDVQSSFSDSITSPEKSTTQLDHTDELLHQAENGFDMAFDRSKVLSKYFGDLISYVKKKAQLETEYAKTLIKLSHQTKTILSEQSFLPFQSLYCTSLDHDREYASNSIAMYQNSLLQNKFVDSLQAKKNELDRKRKHIKEMWLKDKKRLDEAVINMKKMKTYYTARVQEHQKAKGAAMKAEGDQQTAQPQANVKLSGSGAGSTFGAVLLAASSTSSKVDKKKKQEDDANTKASQAMLAYKQSVHEANKKRKEMNRNKALYLQQLRELMSSCDQTAKTVAISYFQLHYSLFAPLPIQFQAMSEDAKLYEPGFQYNEYVRNIPPQSSQSKSINYEFESCSVDGASYQIQGALSDNESSSNPSIGESSPSTSPSNVLRQTESRRHSTGGSLSSEEVLDDKGKEEKQANHLPQLAISDVVGDSSPLPLRAFTKKVAVNVRGAFKTKKLPKSTLFGVDFNTAAQGSPDGIPTLVKKCVVEIDSRALDIKGIYRVNGVKNRVEKLCALFESNSDRVDLSTHSPHDVSGVLKLFFRQLPDPLLQFNFYNTFVNIAKDYQQLINSVNKASDRSSDNPPPQSSTELMNRHLSRLRDTIAQLPHENRNTLQYVISHLTRVAFRSHDNKMTSSNLAIVFGPTLLRPLTTDGNESLKMLIDLPFQSRIVEMLINHKDFIFNTHSHQAGNIFPFSGFNQTPPTFSSDNRTLPEANSSFLASLNHDTIQSTRDSTISLNRDILLSFDDDQVSTSTDNTTTDSQYNTAAPSLAALLINGNREVVSSSSSLNKQVTQPQQVAYSDQLLSLSSCFYQPEVSSSIVSPTNPFLLDILPQDRTSNLPSAAFKSSEKEVLNDTASDTSTNNLVSNNKNYSQFDYDDVVSESSGPSDAVLSPIQTPPLTPMKISQSNTYTLVDISSWDDVAM